MAQFGKKVWFRKIEEDVVSSFASRMTQARNLWWSSGSNGSSFVYDKGVVRGKKLDETVSERCMRRHELGRFLWHAVANGSS